MFFLSSGHSCARSQVRTQARTRPASRWATALTAAACLFTAACSGADATTGSATGSADAASATAAGTHAGVACRDLPAVYGPWFSEAVVALTVVERLHVVPPANQRPVVDLEMGRLAPLTDALYDTVIGYSNLYMRHLASALVMYRAETRALAAFAKEHEVRDSDSAVGELVRRQRWAFDEAVVAWSDFLALCPPSSSSPSRNLPRLPEAQAADQVRHYVDVVAYALPLSLPDGAVRPAACDGADAHAGDGRYRIGAQADVPVKPKHLDAIVRLASLLRTMYQVTVLRELTAGTGQAELDVRDTVTGARITLVSTGTDTMRLTVHTGCVLPPPGQPAPLR